jgi:hypothetical protein
VSDAVGNDLDREAFRIADRFIPSLAVTHYTREFENLCDPAAILFAIQLNREIHSFIILHGQWSPHFDPNMLKYESR